jgi:hypothetical protein
MSNYHYSIPTTVEPALNGTNPGGFTSADRFVIRTDINKGSQTKPATHRLAGLVIIQKYVNNAWTAIEASDYVRLDPYAGVSGFLYSLSVRVNDIEYESILEYGKLTSILNKCKYMSYDMACNSDSVMELMNYPSDMYMDSTATNAKSMQGMLFPIDTEAAEMPFSLDLMCGVNKVAIPSSRADKIEFSFRLQDVNKSGLTSPTAAPFRFFLKNVELRFMTETEQPRQGPLVMPIYNHSFLASIINKVNSITHSPASPFHTMFMTFLKNSHINTGSNDFTKSYLTDEALTEKPALVEFKVNNSSDVLKYPLRFIGSEILYQFMRAVKQGWTNSGDITYASLAQTIKANFGIGSILSKQYPPNTSVSVNIQLETVPTEPYSCFVYTIGEIQL